MLKNKVELALIGAKNKLTRLSREKLRGDSHFVAILIGIAVVCVVSIVYKEEIVAWFREAFNNFEGSTQGIFEIS